MRRNRNILIASSSYSYEEYAPVARILREKGHEVAIYNADKVAKGLEPFSLVISDTGTVSISVDGRDVSPGQLNSAWYRKVNDFFGPDDVINDKAKQLLIRDELESLHETIWSLYPEDVWLSPPERMRVASQKLGQLVVACHVGFAVAPTVVSNEWRSIEDSLDTRDAVTDIIAKMIHGVLIEGNVEKAMPTTVLNSQLVAKLKGLTIPFPGLYQPYVPKAREWRVTVVGDRIFPAAIYTTEEAKDDWRKHQLTNAVTFENAQLNDEVSQKCAAYVKAMGLGFGAIDLIETPEGETVFLECNPNGQYYWLEERLGLPISQAIAADLTSPTGAE